MWLLSFYSPLAPHFLCGLPGLLCQGGVLHPKHSQAQHTVMTFSSSPVPPSGSLLFTLRKCILHLVSQPVREIAPRWDGERCRWISPSHHHQHECSSQSQHEPFHLPHFTWTGHVRAFCNLILMIQFSFFNLFL